MQQPGATPSQAGAQAVPSCRWSERRQGQEGRSKKAAAGQLLRLVQAPVHAPLQRRSRRAVRLGCAGRRRAEQEEAQAPAARSTCLQEGKVIHTCAQACHAADPPSIQQRRGRALVVGRQPQEGLHLRAVARVRVPAAPVTCARITNNLSPPAPLGRLTTHTGDAVTEEALLSATATSVRIRPCMSPVCMQGSAAARLVTSPMRGCCAADTTPPTHAPRRTQTMW